MAGISYQTTLVARQVKECHEYRCQVCSLQLPTREGNYAEAVHIRPTGRPHEGPDVAANVLCLCPNHRVLFRSGVVAVQNDLSLVGEPRRLRTVPRHVVGIDFLAYHRVHHARLPA